MMSDRDRKIQDRAYEIWVEGGRQEGTADRNWEQAVHEIAARGEAGSDDGAAAAEPAAPKTKAPKSEAPKNASGKAAAKEAGGRKAKAASPKEPGSKKAGKAKGGEKSPETKPRAKK